MAAEAEIVSQRYAVLTKLADSWILRAEHDDAERAEAEAFRWRRIYGPGRTRIAEYWAAQDSPARVRSFEPVPLAANDPTPPRPAPRPAAAPLNWPGACLRGLVLYFAWQLANRLIDLAILLHEAPRLG